MKRIIFILILLSFVLFCTSCDYEGDEQRRKIAEVLLRVKEAVNASDRNELSKLVSEEYSYDNLDKEQFLDSILKQDLYIDGYNMEKVDLKEDRTQAKVVAQWRMPGGTTTVRIPVFQQQVSSLNLTAYSRIRFFLQKEGNDAWRISRAQQLDKVYDGSWGEYPTRIEELEYKPDSARQGESVEMRIRIKKGQKDNAVFLVVNGILVGGYSLSGLDDYLVDDPFIQMFRIPDDFPERSFYEIKVFSFEGQVNPMNIDASELKGLNYKLVLLPVRS